MINWGQQSRNILYIHLLIESKLMISSPDLIMDLKYIKHMQKMKREIRMKSYNKFIKTWIELLRIMDMLKVLIFIIKENFFKGRKSISG